MIEINNIEKNFGKKRAVHIEQFAIPDGEMLGVVGNNGAGKSTLFRLILDLLAPDTGHVTINGQDVKGNESWKQFTGAYLDDSFLIDYLTPEEFFHFIGKVYGMTKDAIDARLAEFEKLMNGEILGQNKFIRDYSMGNKQKIGIIAAMLHEPDILILDEPFNFLDPSSQSAVKHLLKKYNEEKEATIIVSSHNLNHTVEISSKIALMEDGEIIREIDNKDNSATTELEHYFNVEE
ncbi:MAG TPA: ABC transporter ATP-binding protein [Candidatus Avibacteroides excrementipullorum]|nr:ABC transporter ATP-binding protein [Candidatus Avibacteroides excrementipullorum]